MIRSTSFWIVVFLGFAATVSCSQNAVVVSVYKSRIDSPPAYPVQAILYGDTRTTISLEVWRGDTHKERRAVAERVAAENPAFVFNTGDIVGWGADNSSWEEFDEDYRDLRQRGIPYFPILGNHDYMGNNAQAMANYFSRFPDLHKRKCYDLVCRNVAFIACDSNFDELADYEKKFQREWLDYKLREYENDKRISLVVLLFHHPPYTNAVVHGESTSVQSEILDLLPLCPKARLVVSGHNHSYEHFLVKGVHYIVSGGGGAPLFPVQTEEKKQRRRDLYTGPPLRGFHYCKLIYDSSLAQLAMFERDAAGNWQEKDRFPIEFSGAQSEK